MGEAQKQEAWPPSPQAPRTGIAKATLSPKETPPWPGLLKKQRRRGQEVLFILLGFHRTALGAPGHPREVSRGGKLGGQGRGQSEKGCKRHHE